MLTPPLTRGAGASDRRTIPPAHALDAVLASCAENTSTAAILRDRSDYEQSLRCAQRASHPDRGGTHEAFLRVQEAKAVLDRYFAGERGGR